MAYNNYAQKKIFFVSLILIVKKDSSEIEDFPF